MAVHIALSWSDDCAKELETLGFKKVEVYLKATGKTDQDGEREFFAMKDKPHQFLCKSYWGIGPD